VFDRIPEQVLEDFAEATLVGQDIGQFC